MNDHRAALALMLAYGWTWDQVENLPPAAITFALAALNEPLTRRSTPLVAGIGTWGLALAFDTNEFEFARGFDAGKIWGRLLFEQPAEADVNILAANAEMLMRIAEAAGYGYEAVEHGSDHLDVHLTRKQDQR